MANTSSGADPADAYLGATTEIYRRRLPDGQDFVVRLSTESYAEVFGLRWTAPTGSADLCLGDHALFLGVPGDVGSWGSAWVATRWFDGPKPTQPAVLQSSMSAAEETIPATEFLVVRTDTDAAAVVLAASDGTELDRAPVANSIAMVVVAPRARAEGERVTDLSVRVVGADGQQSAPLPLAWPESDAPSECGPGDPPQRPLPPSGSQPAHPESAATEIRQRHALLVKLRSPTWTPAHSGTWRPARHTRSTNSSSRSPTRPGSATRSPPPPPPVRTDSVLLCSMARCGRSHEPRSAKTSPSRKPSASPTRRASNPHPTHSGMRRGKNGSAEQCTTPATMPAPAFTVLIRAARPRAELPLGMVDTSAGIGHNALVRLVHLGVLAVSSLAYGCSSGDIARVSGACDLLTTDEVANAVQADAQTGVLTNAIGESQPRLCSFKVSGQLGTVLVYLGEGDAPANTDPNRATEVRGDTYVIVFAQNLAKSFPEEAASLADIAIGRAARQ